MERCGSARRARHENRGSSENKKRFDRELRDEELRRHGHPVQSESLTDYADVNFRYLRATGLVSGHRAGIAITAEKRRVVDLILAEVDAALDASAYLRRLWDGAPLPTDDESEAIIAIRSLECELLGAGKTVAVSELAEKSPSDLQIIRLGLEEQRLFLREELFAKSQGDEIEDICNLLALMGN